MPDSCDLNGGDAFDCNGNGVLDSCDVEAGTGEDCDGDGILDECEMPRTFTASSGVLGPLGPAAPEVFLVPSPPVADSDVTIAVMIVAPVTYEPVDVFLNDNAVLDECDITSGASADVDSDGVPDECEPDCNGDGVPDAYDFAQGAATDCNNNGVPDSCKVADGTATDCDGNAVLDECEIERVFTAESEMLGPLGAYYPDSFTLHSPPRAVGEVVLELAAVAPIETGQPLRVRLNGTLVATFEDFNPYACRTMTLAHATIDANLFDQLVAGGDAEFVLEAGFSRSHCGLPPEPHRRSWYTASVKIRYLTEGRSDCDGNGLPDACDLAPPETADCNDNGFLDRCERLREVSASVLADGLTAPSVIVPAQGDYPPGYYVTDPDTRQVWRVPPDGSPPELFATLSEEPHGAVFAPAEFTGDGERLFVFQGEHVYRIGPDGSASFFAGVSGVTGGGIAYVPQAVGGPAAGKLVVTVDGNYYIDHDFRAEIAAIDSAGDVTVIAAPPHQYWSMPALAPATFGDAAGRLLLPTTDGWHLDMLDLQTLGIERFADIPLPARKLGIGQAAFSPIGWGTWISDSLVDESVLVLCVTEIDSPPFGALQVWDQRGNLRAVLTPYNTGVLFDPRGVAFADGDLLVSDGFLGRVLRWSFDGVDCNTNDVLDSCDIQADPTLDSNGNGVIDSCDRLGDVNGDDVVDLADWASWASCATGPDGGPCSPPCVLFDSDGDSDVDLVDFTRFQSTMTTPP